MNKPFDDESIQRMLEPFNRDHYQLRTELMGALPAETSNAQQPRRRRQWKEIPIMKRRIIRFGIITAAAVIVIAFLNLRPSHTGDGIAWADVIRQIQAAQSAYMKVIIRDKGIAEVYLKMPDKMRQIASKGVIDDSPKAVISVVNGTHMLQLFPDDKWYSLDETDFMKNNPLEQTMQENLLFIDSLDSANGQGFLKVQIAGGRVLLVPEGTRERNGVVLLRYRLENTEPRQPGVSSEGQWYCWFDPAVRSPVVFTIERTIEGKLIETASIEIKLNSDLPDELFSTEPPAGYTRLVAVPDDVNEIVAAYKKSRDLIQHYRMVIWQSLAPLARGLRDGNNLRADFFSSRPCMNPSQDFETAWKLPAELVRIYRNGQSQEHPDAWRYFLPDIGWPAMPESRAVLGGEPNWVFQRLPNRLDHPELVGVRAENIRGEHNNILHIFWLDPSRDYLCVLHEEHHRLSRLWKDKLNWTPAEPEIDPRQDSSSGQEFDWIREITEFSQTPEGHWYAKTIRRITRMINDGKSYKWSEPFVTTIQLDVNSPIPADIFDQSADAPKRQ